MPAHMDLLARRRLYTQQPECTSSMFEINIHIHNYSLLQCIFASRQAPTMPAAAPGGGGGGGPMGPAQGGLERGPAVPELLMTP